MYNQSKEINLDSDNLEDIVFSQDSEHMGGFKNYKSVSNNNENFSDEYMGGYNNRQFGGTAMVRRVVNAAGTAVRGRLSVPTAVPTAATISVDVAMSKVKKIFEDEKASDLISSTIIDNEEEFLKQLNSYVSQLEDNNFSNTHFLKKKKV
mgnify:CR=1 FL=1